MGSSPIGHTILITGVVQLVRTHPQDEVIGSSPIAGTIFIGKLK